MSSRERKRAARRKRKQRSSDRPAEGGAPAQGAGDAGGGPPEIGGDDAGETRSAATGGEAGTGEARANGRPADGGAGEGEDLAAIAAARGMTRSELRDERAREALEPLAEGERPTVVTVGAVISAAIAASIVIAWLAGAEVRVGNGDITERPNALQVFPPAILFAVMAAGMWQSRYWAVLGFQAIMAILMLGSVITLLAATSVFKAVTSLSVLIASAALFWRTVKALARIQMPKPRQARRQ